MKLNQLFGSVPAIEIGGLAIDSRKVKPGDMYFCLEGMVNDGHAFAADAVQAGAVSCMPRIWMRCRKARYMSRSAM